MKHYLLGVLLVLPINIMLFDVGCALIGTAGAAAFGLFYFRGHH